MSKENKIPEFTPKQYKFVYQAILDASKLLLANKNIAGANAGIKALRDLLLATWIHRKPSKHEKPD